MVDDREPVSRSAQRTVWMASFPKSGNTWVRAILTALETGDHMFGLARLSFGRQPSAIGSALHRWQLDPRWFDRTEVQAIRHGLGVTSVEAEKLEQSVCRGGSPLLFRKTHEAYRTGPPGHEPFPTAATRGAILIVRDPRDVVCSWAPFFGIEVDESVERVCHGSDQWHAIDSPADMATAEPWGNWASHAASWLAEDVPFPVHVVRYEDLHADAVATLHPVLTEFGWEVGEAELRSAVDRTRFARLRADEEDSQFRGASSKSEVFFRKGRAEAWRSLLSDDQVRVVEESLAEPMERFGYWVHDGPPTVD